MQHSSGRAREDPIGVDLGKRPHDMHEPLFGTELAPERGTRVYPRSQQEDLPSTATNRPLIGARTQHEAAPGAFRRI